MMWENLKNMDDTSEKWNLSSSKVTKKKNSMSDFTLSLSIYGYNC